MTLPADINTLALDDAEPNAALLTPDVRSGATFAFGGAGQNDMNAPRCLVIWHYRAKAPADFVDAVGRYERSGDLSNIPTGLSYLGTYAVSVSSASPDFEFRTLWGLADLTHLQTLNNYVHHSNSQTFKDMLARIELRPLMRTEIMGLAAEAAPMTASHPA